MLEIKLQSKTKTKRLRTQPKTFAELTEIVETQIRDERNSEYLLFKESHGNVRDYSIKYVDEDNEEINVSDDDDLVMAYRHTDDVLDSKLRLLVDFKPLPQ